MFVGFVFVGFLPFAFRFGREQRAIRIEEFDMHLNLLTGSDGDAAGFRALELPVDFHAAHF